MADATPGALPKKQAMHEFGTKVPTKISEGCGCPENCRCGNPCSCGSNCRCAVESPAAGVSVTATTGAGDMSGTPLYCTCGTNCRCQDPCSCARAETGGETNATASGCRCGECCSCSPANCNH